MKRLISILLVVLAASFAARAQEKQAEPQHSAGTMPMKQMMQDCPMNVPGAEIAVADTPEGAAVSITTKSGNVDELRRRAERMASMHTAKYEAIINGARLTLTPKDPAQLNEFRQQVRSHVAHMSSKEGGCSMMQGMMNGTMGGMRKPTAEPKPEPKKDESGADHNAHHPK